MAWNTSSNETNTLDSEANLGIAYWEQIVTAVALLVIAIAGLFGNSMIILAVSFSRKLQTVTNAFVINLAVADFLTSFVLIWFAVGALGKDGWPIPQAYWICEVVGFSILAFICTSLYNLAAIAVDRVVRITKSHLYRKIFTPWKIAVLLAITWIIPAGSNIIVVVAGNGGFGYHKLRKECATLEKGAEEFLLAELVGLVPPCTTIVLSYIWIYIYHSVTEACQ